MSSMSSKSDPTPPFAREVLQLYADALAEVRFPDLDLNVLKAADEQLHAAQRDVERVETELESVRAALRECEAVLRTRAERGLAYARVFAAGDAELAARVARIGSSEGGQPLPEARPEKRKRRKRGQHDAGLFGSDAPLDDSTSEDATSEDATGEDATGEDSDAVTESAA